MGPYHTLPLLGVQACSQPSEVGHRPQYPTIAQTIRTGRYRSANLQESRRFARLSLLLHKSIGICPIPLNLCGFCENRADLQEKHMKNKHRPQRSNLTGCLGKTKGTGMVIAEKERQMNGAQGFYSKTSFYRSLEF